MALTAEVKAELARVVLTKTSVRVAELASTMRFGGGLHLISGRVAIEIELDNQDAAKKVLRTLVEIYGAKPELSLIQASGIRKSNHYLVRVLEAETLARQTGLLDNRGRPVRGLPGNLVNGSADDIAAIWRGAFIARGSLTDPGRSASLEITTPGNESAMALVGAARRMGISAKTREVRGVHRVVIRDGEAISSLLLQIGASSSVKNWEELRQRREVRANANRLVNFDDANLRRSAQAAVAACARVERALEVLADDVPAHLRYAGEIRLQFREASLDELGQNADPPLTKDAIAGRIRRLLAMADKKAAELGIPGTEANLPSELAEL
ncbi:MAG: DNA-binding protein WhiA [Microbacteriaceae bacterium]